MDLKAIGQEIAKLGLPLLGAALPLPGGAAIGAALANVIGGSGTPADILTTLQQSADALTKARQFELTNQETLLRIQVEAETAATQAVNATMQAEAASAHWPTYSWRPAIGFAVAFNTAVSSLLVLLAFVAQIAGSAKAPAIVASLPSVLGSLAAISATVLPILGIASYWRGRAQVAGNVDTRG